MTRNNSFYFFKMIQIQLLYFFLNIIAIRFVYTVLEDSLLALVEMLIVFILITLQLFVMNSVGQMFSIGNIWKYNLPAKDFLFFFLFRCLSSVYRLE